MPTYKLTHEEYKKFCNNIQKQHSGPFIPSYDEVTSNDIIQRFNWALTSEGHKYWNDIYCRMCIPGFDEI